MRLSGAIMISLSTRTALAARASSSSPARASTLTSRPRANSTTTSIRQKGMGSSSRAAARAGFTGAGWWIGSGNWTPPRQMSSGDERDQADQSEQAGPAQGGAGVDAGTAGVAGARWNGETLQADEGEIVHRAARGGDWSEVGQLARIGEDLRQIAPFGHLGRAVRRRHVVEHRPEPSRVVERRTGRGDGGRARTIGADRAGRGRRRIDSIEMIVALTPGAVEHVAEGGEAGHLDAEIAEVDRGRLDRVELPEHAGTGGHPQAAVTGEGEREIELPIDVAAAQIQHADGGGKTGGRIDRQQGLHRIGIGYRVELAVGTDREPFDIGDARCAGRRGPADFRRRARGEIDPVQR